MNCCSKQTKSWLKMLFVASLGLTVIGIVSGVGAYVGSQWSSSNDHAIQLPVELNAAGAVRNDRLSMATGLIFDNAEGLWILDHETGNLQCWVLNSRTGAVGGIYTTNVSADLELGKGKSELLMTSGDFFFSGNGRAGNLRPANSICYVANANSGIIAGYSAVFNRQAVNRGIASNGPLTRVCYGKIGEGQTTRDQ